MLRSMSLAKTLSLFRAVANRAGTAGNEICYDTECRCMARKWYLLQSKMQSGRSLGLMVEVMVLTGKQSSSVSLARATSYIPCAYFALQRLFYFGHADYGYRWRPWSWVVSWYCIPIHFSSLFIPIHECRLKFWTITQAGRAFIVGFMVKLAVTCGNL